MPDSPTISPDEALTLLLDGNQRFVSGAPEHPNQDAQRRSALAPSQNPFAVLFGCSDSRLAAEIIFDRGLASVVHRSYRLILCP
jgi:carbonic anhydrase